MKILFTLVFILSVNLSPIGSWPAYVLYLTLITAGILLSRLSLKHLLLRSLISLPFILAALPLLFTGSEPYLQVMVFMRTSLIISQPGIIAFLSIVIKSWLSLMAAILLSSTTRFEELLSAFRKIGLPKLLVAILSLMWRYLSLMVDEARSLTRARDSRSAGHSTRGTLVWRASITGKMVGNLLLRSLERSERVYAAMSSRGYTGEPINRISDRLTKKDWWVLGWGILLSLLILALAILSS